MERCAWVPEGDELYAAYHDEEWGVPEHDDRALYELLTLEGAQAGLSWSTILRKREGYRRAFAGFDPAAVARFDRSPDRGAPPGRRHRPQPAQGRVGGRERRGGCWRRRRSSAASPRSSGASSTGSRSSAAGRRVAEIPAETPVSKAMSKELKRRGFRFVGPTVCYAFMQAAGLVNDHVVSCFRYEELHRLTRRPGVRCIIPGEYGYGDGDRHDRKEATEGTAMKLEGIHHVTAITADAPGNVDFYTACSG